MNSSLPTGRSSIIELAIGIALVAVALAFAFTRDWSLVFLSALIAAVLGIERLTS